MIWEEPMDKYYAVFGPTLYELMINCWLYQEGFMCSERVCATGVRGAICDGHCKLISHMIDKWLVRKG